MPIAAIYARYSDESQSPSSIEDQVRRCKEGASKAGYTVPEELTFSDAAVSGKGSLVNKREGFQKLIAAWEAGQFEALFVDEQSRLVRSYFESAKLMERIDRTKVRLITADGIDSNGPNWRLTYGIMSVLAEHFLAETAHRVVRGMLGQLERGFMIASAPLGYDIVRRPEGSDGGTKWCVNE